MTSIPSTVPMSSNLLIIESPYAGNRGSNCEYARKVMKHFAFKGCPSFASHLYYTQVLDDFKFNERRLGIDLGFAIWPLATQIIFATDLGWSRGMLHAAKKALTECKPFDLFSFDIGGPFYPTSQTQTLTLTEIQYALSAHNDDNYDCRYARSF